MAITGSTRMQATSIQLCVMLMVLEMVARELVCEAGSAPAPGAVGRAPRQTVAADEASTATREGACAPPNVDSAFVPARFLAALEQLHANVKSPEALAQLAGLVALEESVYRAGHKNNYFADHFGIDVLTDTTERSPTYCTPPFRKFDDTAAAESWAFLFLPHGSTPEAWRHILKREPRCVEWDENEVRDLLEGRAVTSLPAVAGHKDRRAGDCASYQLPKINRAELMRFRIGLDGLKYRRLGPGDSAVAIVSEREEESLLSPDGFFHVQLEAARRAGAKTALIYFGGSRREEALFLKSAIGNRQSAIVLVPVPETDFLLDGVTRVAVKLVMNALSTCTMVRLGRVMANTMVWVVPSNLKLIDRATRYVAQLTDLTYEAANNLLFEVIEYVEPRIKSDQAYPPVVGMAVLRAKHKLTNEEAEKQLAK
jgi:N-acetylmuramic acid 6-phosphate etherase